MLASLLGGTTYAFGLILALALLGIGGGGLLYGRLQRGATPAPAAFALTCAVEALLLLVPFALGDRLALLAMLLRPLGDVSFALLAGAWTVVAGIVVLPASVVAGYQFPLLVALLGGGRPRLGREVGEIYAWNTAGALLGALAGGFLLLPRLTAPGAWRAAAALLLALALATLWLGRRRAPKRRAVAPALAAAAGLLLLVAPGPSAVWRHTPIGAGGMPSRFAGPNELRAMMQAVRRAIVWQAEGREASLAIHALDEVSFLIDGKADGSALKDAPTQVMSGLIGAALHPEPRRALVIGLGTGSSAGWLARAAPVERLDVVELEPAVVEVARRCAAVNHRVLDDPKVRLWIGDAREHLLATRERYDLIFSEPSNPYRAGVASLFSRGFYRAAAARLEDDGLFLQWLQAYDVDPQAVRSLIATVAGVFPHLEIWQVQSDDLLLVAARRPLVHDRARLEARLAASPWREALRDVWGVEGIEGFYAGYVAGPAFARAVLRAAGDDLATDDRPRFELRLARSLGRDLEFSVGRLRTLVRLRGEDRPPVGVDPLLLLDRRSARDAMWGRAAAGDGSGDDELDWRRMARAAYARGELIQAGRLWSRQGAEPELLIDRLLAGEAWAETADPRAASIAELLVASQHPVEAAAINARALARRGDAAGAAGELARGFALLAGHPWSHRPVVERMLDLAADLARSSPALGPGLHAALARPFAVHLADDLRLRTRLEIARAGDFPRLCGDALEPFEPHVPWEEAFLDARARCYRATGHPLARQARADLEAFRRRATPDMIDQIDAIDPPALEP
ncbi:MAG: spermidine synthase [Acidobacteria bacterium]|nr:MAG: spermidine synthase [Acidobacteriota bacterium]